jgi:hypothetical protein
LTGSQKVGGSNPPGSTTPPFALLLPSPIAPPEVRIPPAPPPRHSHFYCLLPSPHQKFESPGSTTAPFDIYPYSPSPAKCSNPPGSTTQPLDSFLCRLYPLPLPRLESPRLHQFNASANWGKLPPGSSRCGHYWISSPFSYQQPAASSTHQLLFWP